mgnify:CR=1 FL=1
MDVGVVGNVDGIEFIEFATSRPQALGGVLETFGFRPIARHRSREVELYRQGRFDLDAFVSDRIGIADVEAAFDKMHSGDVLRSVVVMDVRP